METQLILITKNINHSKLPFSFSIYFMMYKEYVFILKIFYRHGLTIQFQRIYDSCKYNDV